MTDDVSTETGEKQRKRPRGKPFVKGDPRINRRGVPPEAIAARKFIQQVGAEIIKLPTSADGKAAEEITRYYAMVRLMFSRGTPKDREMLIKMMHPGLLVDQTDITSGGQPLKGYVGISPEDWDKKPDAGDA